MSVLCTGGSVARVLSRHHWAGLRLFWKNVEGSHKFKFGAIEHEGPLGQVLKRCQREKVSTN